MTERLLVWGEGGIRNPDEFLKCGPKDPEAKFLEPAHWGGCKQCASIIKGLLVERYPSRPKGKPAKQVEFDFKTLEDNWD